MSILIVNMRVGFGEKGLRFKDKRPRDINIRRCVLSALTCADPESFDRWVLTQL